MPSALSLPAETGSSDRRIIAEVERTLWQLAERTPDGLLLVCSQALELADALLQAQDRAA